MGRTVTHQPIGKVIHLAKSGRLIVKSKEEVRAGQILHDEKGNKVGKVLEVIGATRAPYLSVIPANEESKRVIGRLVYN